MADIAKQVGTTHATVLYWMKKYGIRRRSWSESAYVKLNPKGDPFSISTNRSVRQETLLWAGILLYWAEGNKGQPAVRLANLDPRMLQLFRAFLREVCHVHENRLHVYVRVHKQFSLATARRYWARLLTISAAQVHVYQHTDPRSHERKQWSRYGLATLQVNSSKLKAWLDRSLEEGLQALLGHAGPSTRRLLQQKQFVLNGHH